MTTPRDEVSWVGVTEEMARQILQQGDTYLQAQWESALAADQRAVTAASIFVGVGTALAGGAAAYTGANHALYWAAITAAVALFLAAAICFWSARPVDFHPPGGQPSGWIKIRKEPLVGALGGEAENYQVYIERNGKILSANAWWFSRGVALAVLGPAISMLGMAIFSS